MPRPKAQYSLAANQLQLAMALSSSLEESTKRELSDLTEELPASNIESGIVPQNIKQMQKEFLEQLQMPRPGPSKKSKKTPKPVPTLTIRSSDERLRIITEKVALVLIKEDSTPCAFDSEINSRKQQEVHEKESVLWSISAMSPLKTRKDSYYIRSLNTFVSPSKVTVGSKVSSMVYAPRRLKTPVKYRSNNHLLSSPNEHVEMSSRQWSTPDQGELKNDDQEYRAQSELQNDWQRMLHNSSLSDISIVVKENVKMWAHKLVLFARCQAIIDDLSENVLHWERVSHVQALAFLEFIYCGKLLSTRALCENVSGVVYLARRYKVTELLKFILASNMYNGASSNDNGDLLECSNYARECGVTSPDLFADSEKSRTSSEIQTTTEITSGESYSTRNKALQPGGMPIEISSDEEEDDLVKNFFGTYNPAVCSPPKSASFLSESQRGRSHTAERDSNEGQSEPLFSESVLLINKSSLSSKSPDETSPSRSKQSLHSRSATKHSRKSLFQTPTKKDDSFEGNKFPLHNRKCEEGVFSPKSSPSSSKRKQFYSDDSDNNSPVRKRLCSLNERVDGTEISSNENTPSPHKFSLSQTSQHQGECFLSSFNSNTSADTSGHVLSSPNTKSPGNRFNLDATENYFSSPTNFKSSSPCKNIVDHEKKLLDDSFSFNVNDSLLLKGLQTPVSKSKQMNPLHSALLRTPLDNIKATSPVTPLPDYAAMSNEEFEAELIKFGLKRNLSRIKGIKMLRHIYEKLHPLVEVITLDGKELHIPLSDKTPIAKSTHLQSRVPKLEDVEEYDDDQSDHEPLSQQSFGSSGGEDMPEETFLEEDDDLSQGITSRDLKKYIYTWITSQPDIHEMILAYEPIWLDSVHDEIKRKFKTKIKLNQLMDILDEEGITFRVAQVQRNVGRNKQSPKKKHAKAKIKQVGSKATQVSSPKKQSTQTSTSSS